MCPVYSYLNEREGVRETERERERDSDSATERETELRGESVCVWRIKKKSNRVRGIG